MTVHGGKAIPSANSLLSSSSTPFTPTGTGSLFSTNNFDHVQGTTCDISIASRNKSALASPCTKHSRVVRLSDARPDRAMATGYNKASTPTWSPPNSIPAIPTASSGFVIGGSKNASPTLRSMVTASGIGEDPRLADSLNSIKNRTESMKGLSPGLRPRPYGNRPVRFPLPRFGFGLNATWGVLIPTPPLATAGGSDGILSPSLNIIPLGTGVSSISRNDLSSTNITKTKGRHPETVKPHRPSLGFSLLGFNTSTFNRTHYHQGVVSGGQYGTNCSGHVTSTAHVVYEMVTSTILVNETITLGQNATSPSPVFVTPPPACQTLTAPCKGVYCPSTRVSLIGPAPKGPKHPYTPPTSTSTLLVTKKSTAVVQQLSAVGNIFGPSTPTPPAVAAPSTSDSQQSTGQNAGPSKPKMSAQSDDSSTPDSDVDGHSPNESMPHQNPTNGNSPSASSDSQNSDSQKPAEGSSGRQSTESDDQTAPTVNEPIGATSNHGDTSGNGGGVSSGNTNTGGASSNGRMPNSGDASNQGDASRKGGTPNSGDTNAGGGVSNNGGTSSNGDSLGSEGGTSSDGAASNRGEGSSNGDDPELEAASSANSHGTQYVPSMVMAGKSPVSIVSNAVIVGSHTIKAGSPPTTVVANGQKVAIQGSQIVAQGKTIPIQAVITPLPATSTTIGSVPVVLRPQDVAIGSKTFEHGSSPSTVLYNGETYSWDASQLVGAGATIAFPTMDSAPRVTAGGQVFSVFPGQLKAPGKDVFLPHIATASPFVYKGQTFSVNPSQIIAPDTSITLPPAGKVTPFIYIDHTLSVDASHFIARSTTIPLSSGFGTVTYNGHVLTIKPTEIIGPSTTIALSALDNSAALPTGITTGGLTFSIGPSAAVLGSSTYSFVPGKAPATIVTHGEAVLVGSNGVQFKNIHIPIPTITPSFSAITQGDLAFSIAPSEVVVAGHTDIIHPDMTPITTVVDGHTISIGPKGVGLASTTIPLPTQKPSFSMATNGDITFSIASSEVVVEGKTYSIASNKAPITTALNGQSMTIGPKGIHIKGTTVNLPTTQRPKSVTAAGLSFLVGATDAVISDTTYAIGSGALLQTVVVGSQTMTIGSAGVTLPPTTIAPEQTPVALIAGGMTFSVDPTEAVVNGTTYAIGSDAVAKTLVEGSIKMILGTNGVVLPSTTIRPWSKPVQTRFPSVLGTSETSPITNGSRTLAPIATGREGDEKYAAGISTRISNGSTLLGLLLGVGTMMLSQR